MPEQLNLFRRRRPPSPHMLSHCDIPGETLGYSVWLATFDDGTMTVGVSGAKRRQTVILTKEQVYRLTRALQSMQTEL